MTMLKRVFSLILMLIVLTLQPVQTAVAESVFVPPTLSKDAPEYDPEKPENLSGDQLYARSAILIEARTGKVIFEKNADAIMYPASTTKIMTALLGIERGDLTATVVTTETALNVPEDSSSMDLRLGEEINFTDLIYGTMLCSANEGANLIAETVGGSIEGFVPLMNQRAREIGCRNTNFVNAHGYHDPNHYTTVRDMALIAREAMQNDLFRQVVACVTYDLPRSNIQRARSLTTSNRLLREPTEDYKNAYYYADAAGIKTGYHSQAGYCIVSYAERDGVELISVVFYSDIYGRWTDTKKLMEYGFAQYVSVTPIELYNMNPITIETRSYSLNDPNMGKLDLICVVSESGQNAYIIATQDEVNEMAKNLRGTMLIEYKRDFVAPVEAGEVMGTMTYVDETGQPIRYNLIAARSIGVRENMPKTIEEIVAEAYADPNPFPPLTLELAIYLVSPFVLLFLLIRAIRKHRKKRESRMSHTPKPGRRYLK